MDSVVWFTQHETSVLSIQWYLLALARMLINLMTGLVSPTIKASAQSHRHHSHQTWPQCLPGTIYFAEWVSGSGKSLDASLLGQVFVDICPSTEILGGVQRCLRWPGGGCSCWFECGLWLQEDWGGRAFRRHVGIKWDEEQSSALIYLLVPPPGLMGWRERGCGRGQPWFTEEPKEVWLLRLLGTSSLSPFVYHGQKLSKEVLPSWGFEENRHLQGRVCKAECGRVLVRHPQDPQEGPIRAEGAVGKGCLESLCL